MTGRGLGLEEFGREFVVVGASAVEEDQGVGVRVRRGGEDSVCGREGR